MLDSTAIRHEPWNKQARWSEGTIQAQGNLGHSLSIADGQIELETLRSST